MEGCLDLGSSSVEVLQNMKHCLALVTLQMAQTVVLVGLLKLLKSFGTSGRHIALQEPLLTKVSKNHRIVLQGHSLYCVLIDD